jgi:hypothetical protein
MHGGSKPTPDALVEAVTITDLSHCCLKADISYLIISPALLQPPLAERSNAMRRAWMS